MTGVRVFVEHLDQSGPTYQSDGETMTYAYGDMIQQSKKKVGEGEDQAQVLSNMKSAGLTIIEAIKVVREVYQLPLGQAKEICARSPLWQEQVIAAKPLHDDLERLFAKPE